MTYFLLQLIGYYFLAGAVLALIVGFSHTVEDLERDPNYRARRDAAITKLRARMVAMFGAESCESARDFSEDRMKAAFNRRYKFLQVCKVLFTWLPSMLLGKFLIWVELDPLAIRVQIKA